MPRILPAAPQRHRWLTIYPLLGGNGSEPAYELLPDAMRAGTLRITEVGAGTVPELLAIHEGDVDVLILDGEQFIGARQNRMASRSIVLPARSETRIPVNCMEAGRWRPTTTTFSDSPQCSPPRVRYHNRKRESACHEAGQAASPEVLRECQGEVWSEIARMSSDYGASTPTGALDEIAAGRAEDIDAWKADFPAVPGQVGLLAFLGDEVLGFDVVGGPAIYERIHERLITGYVHDALRVRRDPGREPDPEAAAGFVGRVASAERSEAPTVGRGVYRVLAGEVMGGELEDGGHVVHLSAFPRSSEPLLFRGRA